MARTRVKICGITSTDDALLAVKAGADAIGLVFYPPSSRFVDHEKALEIIQAIPAFVTTVGLFVDAEVSEVQSTLRKLPLDLLQFHGDESPSYCQQFNRPWMKALRVRPELDLAQVVKQYEQACAILLDTYKPGVPGGTGEIFNWDLVPADLPLPVILAGGLSSTNVAAAIKQVEPFAVDVSGGVEQAPGRKDPAKIAAFMREVASVEQY